VAAEREQARLRKQAEDALAVQAQLRGRADLADKLTAAGRLVADGRFDEAEQIFYQVPDPSTTPMLNSLGLARARSGDWQRAITNFSRIVELSPAEPLPYHFLAPLLLEVGDLKGYAQNRERILHQFADATAPLTVERMLKATLLTPIPPGDVEGVERLGAALETSARRVLSQDGFRVARGLLAYRRGKYSQALALLTNIGPGAKGTNPYLAVEACLISTMAQWQLAQTDQARSTLNSCTVNPDERGKAKTREFGNTWSDWLTCEVLRREAKALMEKSPDATAQPNGG